MRRAGSVLRRGSVGFAAAAFLLSLCAGAGAQAAPKSKSAAGCPVHLTITDEDGKELPKAFVMFHGEHGRNLPFTPDKTGQVKTNLSAGMYDLFVSAMGFTPQAQIVDLRTCKPVDLNLALAIDSDHAGNEDN